MGDSYIERLRERIFKGLRVRSDGPGKAVIYYESDAETYPGERVARMAAMSDEELRAKLGLDDADGLHSKA